MEDNTNIYNEESVEEKPKRKKKSYEPEPENIENTKINFKNGVTVYEGKMAFLIGGAVITLFFALTMYYIREDISSNLTELTEAIIFCIAGVTSVEQAAGMIKSLNLFGNKGQNK